MSAAFQAIINGARANARGAGWACPQLVIRPRDRRPALAVRQDA
ncbi:MAG: hypothetical protein ACRDP3_17120 [Streptomyces sp.]